MTSSQLSLVVTTLKMKLQCETPKSRSAKKAKKFYQVPSLRLAGNTPWYWQYLNKTRINRINAPLIYCQIKARVQLLCVTRSKILLNVKLLQHYSLTALNVEIFLAAATVKLIFFLEIAPHKEHLTAIKFENCLVFILLWNL